MATILLASCGGGNPPATPTSVTRSGTVTKLVDKTYKTGTHQLMMDKNVTAILVAAEPTQLNLESLIGKEVELTGLATPTAENPEIQLIKVLTVKTAAEEVAAPTGYRRYRDEAAGFSVDYAARLTPRAGTHGVAFYATAEQKLAEILVLKNPLEQELAAWLMDKYGYKQTDLAKVGVAGLAGYKFQNPTGAVIYLARGAEVLALAWYDTDAANREINRKIYLEIVQSLTTFTPTAAASGDTTGQNLVGFGGACGGLLNTNCATGLTCKLDANKSDGSGICVTVGGAPLTGGLKAGSVPAANVAAASELELTRGWYYGDRASKKPKTPDDWILVDVGTRFAMWRRPAELPELVLTLPAPTATLGELSRDQQATLSYLQLQMNSLAPEAAKAGAWQLRQVAFAEPNYAYAVYATAEQMRRILVSYTAAGGDVVTITQAYFRPVEGGAWLTLEGVDLAANKSTTVVDGGATAAATVAAGMRAMQNRAAGYGLQYPTNWYWRPAGAAKTEFSDRPFPAGAVLVTAEVLPGQSFTFGEAQPSGQQFAIFVKLKNGSSLKLSAASNQLELLQQMAVSVQDL